MSESNSKANNWPVQLKIGMRARLRNGELYLVMQSVQHIDELVLMHYHGWAQIRFSNHLLGDPAWDIVDVHAAPTLNMDLINLHIVPEKIWSEKWHELFLEVEAARLKLESLNKKYQEALSKHE